MTIVEFLTARLDEDEASALAVDEQYRKWRLREDYIPQLGLFVGTTQAPGYIDPAEAAHILRHDPTQVLADIAAKRQILELAADATGLDMQVDGERRVGPRDMITEPYVGDLILDQLAAPYRDHPDYQQEWDQ